jgi:D-serine deaminase-like pyridoxal phosphate-dependent protein
MKPRFTHDLDTPALLVDAERLDRNIRGMQDATSKAGVLLRPHIKTHKCLAIAKKQIEAGATGLTCAKISEAEVMSAVCEDLFIAYPIVGETKLRRLDQLSNKVRTLISIESLEAAGLIHDHLSRSGRAEDVMVKVETGLARTGVEIEELESFLQNLSNLAHLHAVGLFTHEGKAYGCQGRKEVRGFLTQVASKLGEMREIFQRVIGRDPVISPGCTVTARVVENRDGFTETRPGTYVFGDVNCLHSGMYQEEECALSVLVTVVAVKEDGRVVVDGGSKTFAMDRHQELGHGRVTGHPDLHFDRLSEEHGVLLTEQPGRYKIGDRLEVIPAHVCPVVNLQTNLFIREGERVVDRWQVDARGCIT